jgi:hypothetical protein
VGESEALADVFMSVFLSASLFRKKRTSLPPFVTGTPCSCVRRPHPLWHSGVFEYLVERKAMNPTNPPPLPISERALLNTLILRYRGGELLPQGENLAYLWAIRDIASAAALARTTRQPPLAAIAAWHLAVEETSLETAGFIWDRYVCPHFTEAERGQIVAAKDRLRRQIPSAEFPAAREMHLEQLRGSLRLDEPEAAAPFCLAPGISGERREQMVTRASLEVLRAMRQAGLLSEDELRRYVETFWRAADARARHWRRFQEEETLLDFLKKFVEQTDGARLAGNDSPLSEETWAWKIWVYLEGNEQHQGWLRRRLAEHVPVASARRRAPRRPPPARLETHVPSAVDLRTGLIRFFRLAPILGRSPGHGTSTGGDSLTRLTNDEIRRVARVEVLLAAICPDAAPLASPEIYALPLVRVLREAVAKMRASGIRRSPVYRRAMRVLKRLVLYYSAYDPYAPLIRAPSLARFPADAVKRWEKLIRQLGRDGVEHFRQRTVQLQLVRALSVAITPDQSETNRRVCASPSLRRQLDTERIGLGRRCRGDSHTELATFALKLRGRIKLLRSATDRGPFPPAVAAAAGELLEAANELANLADLALRNGVNSENLSFAVRSLFDNTIRPGYGRLEAAVQSVPPVLGDPDLRRRLNAVREAAARMMWTAEDLIDGFFRERRNVGLRWLLGRRSGEREDDLLSPD